MKECDRGQSPVDDWCRRPQRVPDSGRGLQMKDREGGQHMEAIILDHVGKTFSCGKRAVDSVSLSLEEGEVFGFLGPNGTR